MFDLRVLVQLIFAEQKIEYLDYSDLVIMLLIR